MDINRILQLREEKARLLESLRVIGRMALSDRARTAAFRRVHEIDEEIAAIENPPSNTVDPLDEMTVAELRDLYATKYEAYMGRKVGEPVDPHNPRRSRDARAEAELIGIMTRLQRLEATEADA